MNPPSRFLDEIPEELIERIAPRQATVADRASRAGAVRTDRAVRYEHGSGAEEWDWRVGDKVEHRKWGRGTVVSVKGEGDGLELDIAFASQGIKKLLAKFAPIKKL